MYKKHIVNIQQMCLYNTNTIITSMTIKNVIKLVIKLVMKLKVRRVNTSAPAKAVAFYFVKLGGMNLKLNRKFKDTLFRKVFNNKRDLLSLYNALNNTEHTDESLITINTIEDAIYIGYKNDISFIINSELNLYEHQSSVNPNMPVRGLIYFAELYKGYIDQNNLLIYNERLVKLPFPRYVVFYNGTEEQPEEQELRLSDSFVQVPEGESLKDTAGTEADKTDKPSVEVVVQLLNINYGCNQELMEKCQKLMEYSKFVALVRVKSDMLTEKYKKEMKSVNKKEIFAEAVALAIDEAIRDNVLKDILSKNMAEVTDMLLTEFDEKAYIEGVKKQSYEEGEASGKARGEDKLARLVVELKKRGRVEDIAKVTDEGERERLYREFNI
jgi:hypothetical protein